MRSFIWSGQLLRRTAALAAALLLIVAAGGCVSRAGSFPTGLFTTTIPAEAFGGNEAQAGFVGDWQLTFTDEGKYTLVNKGVEVIRGSYKTDGERITFTQESGIFLEVVGEQISYTWSQEQDKLQFRPVDDPAEERKIVMSSQAWTASQ